MPTAVLWFRRDLRLADNPALAAAARHAGPDGQVVAFFCLDTRLGSPSGAARLAFLSGCLSALDEAIGGRLVVRGRTAGDQGPGAGRPGGGGRRVRRRGLRPLRPRA